MNLNFEYLNYLFFYNKSIIKVIIFDISGIQAKKIINLATLYPPYLIARYINGEKKKLNGTGMLFSKSQAEMGLPSITGRLQTLITIQVRK